MTKFDIIMMCVGYLWFSCVTLVFTLNLWFLTRKHVRYFARRLKVLVSSRPAVHVACVILNGIEIKLARDKIKED
jgi:hypothetical protein